MAEYRVKTSESGAVQGPFSGAQLRTLADSGQLQPHFLVSQDNGASWNEASQYEGLAFVDPDHPPIEADPGEAGSGSPTTSAVQGQQQPPVLFPESHWSRKYALSPSGAVLAIGGEGTVRVWDVGSHELLRVIRGKRDSDVESLAFSSDGAQIAVTFDDDYRVRVFDTETGQREQVLDGNGNEVTAHGTVLGDPAMITSNGYAGTVQRWDLSTGECLSSFVAYGSTTESVARLAVTHDRQLIATCRDNDEDIRVFDLASGERVGVCFGHKTDVKVVTASPVSNVLASGDSDGTIILWDVPSGDVIHRIDTDLRSVEDLAFSPAGDHLLATGMSDQILVLDGRDLSTLRSLECDTNQGRLSISSDGNLLACDTDSGGVAVWHLGSSHESLEQMIEVAEVEDGSDGTFDSDNEDFQESVSGDDDEHWDEDDDPLDEEEEIEGEFDPEGWSLATEGDIEWSELLEAVGLPREASLLTKDAWRAAQAENRVLTIAHAGDGMEYEGRTGLHRGQNLCRVVVGQSMPDEIRVLNVDPSQMDWNFYQATTDASDASEALVGACSEGDADAVRQALDNGADVSFNDYQTQLNPLKAAIASGSVEIVELLIESGLGPESESGGWRIAMSRGQAEIARILAEHGFEQEPAEALLEASHLGVSEAVTGLVPLVESIDASVTIWGGSGLDGTPLTVAAAAGHAEVVSQLIEAGADPLLADSRNVTPWVAAVSAGQDAISDLLVSHGAQADSAQALVVAASRGQLAVVTSLVDQGADVNQASEFGESSMTALEAVVKSDQIDVDSDEDNEHEAAEVIRESVVEALLQRGMDPNSSNQSGQPILHSAVEHDRASCLRILIEAGADLEATDSDGRTALLVAVARNDESLVGQLLLRGANPSVSDGDGLPALLQMFDEYSQCNATLVKWLICFGVDLDAADSQGMVLEQHCQKVMRRGSEEDEYSYESAESVLELLHNTEQLQQLHGLMTRPVQTNEDCLEQADCAVELLENGDLAYRVVSNRVADPSCETTELLGRLLEHDDWRLRYAAARSFGNANAPAEQLLPLMIGTLVDPDEDVVESGASAITDFGRDDGMPQLVAELANCPDNILQRLFNVLSAIDDDRRPEVVAAVEAMLPDDPESTEGTERCRAGLVVGLQGVIQQETGDLDAASESYGRSVALNPDAVIGFWIEWALLRSQQEDESLQDALQAYREANEAETREEYLQLLERSIELSADFPWGRNDLAWVLATSTYRELRDGQRAVGLGTEVCEQNEWHFHGFLDTLAAAVVETGDFGQAVEYMNRALAGAPESYQATYQENLQRYQAQEPWPFSEDEEAEDALELDDVDELT